MVLNAKQDQDEDEAALVASAGQPGRVTVATHMAGRGTDTVLVTWRRGLPALATGLLRWRAQASAEALQREVREANLQQDRHLARLLVFSGRGE